MKIKVMIVDDQVILSEGIRSVVSSSDKLEVIAVAHSGREALERMEEQVPDVVLLDIRMPDMNGVVTTGEIKKRYPEVKVLILTTFDDSDYILMVTADRELRLRRAFGFSDREVEIALMLYEGFNNRQIASALNLSDGTARNYISAIYMKLGCDGRPSAIEKMKEVLGG